MYLIIGLLTALLTLGAGSAAAPAGSGDPVPGSERPVPEGLDEARRFEACYSDYEDPARNEDDEVCRPIYPGEVDSSGNDNELDGVSPTGLPILTHEVGGDPPIGNLQGMDLPTMLLSVARGCAGSEDEDETFWVQAVQLTSEVQPEPDASYPRDADDVAEGWYDTMVADTLLFAATPMTGRAVEKSGHPAAENPATRKGGDVLVGFECATSWGYDDDHGDDFEAFGGVGATTAIELPAEEDAVLEAFEQEVRAAAAEPELQLARNYDASMPKVLDGEMAPIGNVSIGG